MIGRVTKSHGIKGEVSVDITTEDPDIRFAVGQVLRGRQGKKTHELTVSSVRPHKGRLLVSFEEIADRTQADALRGTQFFAPPLESEDNDGFYDHELEGLRVRHEGNVIGEVVGVTHGPSQSLLEVELEAGKTALIPFVAEMVPEVDLAQGVCDITPPEGLLEL